MNCDRLLLATALATSLATAAEPYREPFAQSFPIREQQHQQIKAYADALLQEQIQRALLRVAPDFTSPTAYERSLEADRERLRAFHGIPLPHAKAGTVTKFERVGEDDDAVIFRVWIEVLPGVDAYGLYLLPRKPAPSDRHPLLIAQHGGGGNPEAISDLDTRVNYRSFGREAIRRGYAVWAPALAMRCGYCEDPVIPGANRELLDQKLKLAGTSIIGLELHKIIESTQTLLRVRPELDAARVGMTGLSWGGYFTMHATALAPFIKVAAPSGYFRDFERLLQRAAADDSRLTERDVFHGLGHAQVIALICPRPCLVQLGEQDGALNPLPGARTEAERAAAYYRQLGVGDRFQFQVHAGGHEFDTPAILDFFDRHLR